MLPSNSANFSDVVDEAGVSLSCSIAFNDTNISKSLQELGPGVFSYAVPQSNPYFMILVIVFLKVSWKKGKSQF